MSISRQCLEAKYGMVWSAAELDREFVVTAIIAPHVVVRRKADNAVGTLEFSGEFYFNWHPQEQLDVMDQKEVERPRAKFPLGQIVATPGALEALEESGQTADFFLDQHAAGRWGTVDKDDWLANDQALVDGSRILSAYTTLKGRRLWCITEATNDNGERAATTLLLPEEY